MKQEEQNLDFFFCSSGPSWGGPASHLCPPVQLRSATVSSCSFLLTQHSSGHLCSSTPQLGFMSWTRTSAAVSRRPPQRNLLMLLAPSVLQTQLKPFLAPPHTLNQEHI